MVHLPPPAGVSINHILSLLAAGALSCLIPPCYQLHSPETNPARLLEFTIECGQIRSLYSLYRRDLISLTRILDLVVMGRLSVYLRNQLPLGDTRASRVSELRLNGVCLPMP